MRRGKEGEIKEHEARDRYYDQYERSEEVITPATTHSLDLTIASVLPDKSGTGFSS